MNIEALAEKIFSEVKNYVDRCTAGMKGYVDGEISKANAQAKQLNDASSLRLDSRIDKAVVQNPESEVEALLRERSSYSETLKSFQRQATRHAEHLQKLESRMRKLENKGIADGA